MDPLAGTGHGIIDRHFHPRRWIILREEDHAAPRRCFLNVSTGKSILIDLPDLHGHCVFGPTAEGLLLLRLWPHR
ncbi:hypothetical protein E2562_008898 [Oryza meyeriana var. granulata]|uniref:Uncharacterized protein n=1 Tax=Oryza meyeriana var. granulata TaxID=110450 RepID=A0A6G1D297_9ORYZ|nr:hypothetical protein E2562_008898 [Oryza meyeriana var. granulata]